MGKRRGLGRGLDALLPGAESIPATAAGATRVLIDLVEVNPEQPRRLFDEEELQALAESIRLHGILQPLLAVRTSAGYRLIAGERRLRAARLAGLTEVPVLVRDEEGPESSLALSLVENIQRNELGPLDEAEAYRRLVDEFHLTQEEAARRVGRSRAHVANSLRLLGLVPAVLSALSGGAITAGHARALAVLEPHTQEEYLRRVLREQMSVRQVEELVQKGIGRPARKGRRSALPETDANTRALEEEFGRALQAKVTLVRRRGKGRLVVEFFSDDELDALYRRIVSRES